MTRPVHLFFIAGAPRCGTTAMARYLGKHRDICFSKPKETHYFLFPRPMLDAHAQRAEFLAAYFPDRTAETKIIGEGAVSTLYSKEAITRILASFPTAKFIVMLRDPVEMMRSYHARLLHLRQEDVRDLPTAWALQDTRAEGRNIPRFCQDPRVLKYGEIARLGFYATQLRDLVGKENCLPVFFDDFMSDTLATYKNVLQFLDVPYDGRVAFKRTNPASSHRIGLLQRLYTGPLMRPVAGRLLNNPVRAAQIQRALRKLRKRMKRINAVEVASPPLDPMFANRLRAELCDDITLLGQTFDRDLSHWQTPA